MEAMVERIKSIQSKKEELENIKKQIANKRTAFEREIEKMRKEFEDSLEPLKENSNRTFEEFNLLASNKVCVSLGNLVTQLSSLTGISTSDMGISIRTNVAYWGKYKLETIAALMNSSPSSLRCIGCSDKDNSLRLILYADKSISCWDEKQAFCYDMTFKLNLEELQSDGISLLEHCSVKVGYDDFAEDYFTTLVIDKNIGGLNCNFSLGSIVQDDVTNGFKDSWFPSDLLRQAIINCVEKPIVENKIILKPKTK